MLIIDRLKFVYGFRKLPRMPELSILTKAGAEEALTDRIARSRAALGPAAAFDYPAEFRGSTPHFRVYYDPALGASAVPAANAVLTNCEHDFAAVQAWFGGLTPPGMPFQIVVAPLDPSGNGGGGAYHWGCPATTIYCDARWLPSFDPEYTRLVAIAEVIEVFEAAQAKGWNCAANNGEGLSRVLAEELHPAGVLPWMISSAAWLDTPGRPDYVSAIDTSDRNYVSTGCAVLFLNYLRYQLDFNWGEIVQAAGPTLEQVYGSLTHASGGYAALTALLQPFYPAGKPSGLKTDNPFPLAQPARFPVSGVQFRGAIGGSATLTWATYDWPGLWHVVWSVVPTSVGNTSQIRSTVEVQKTPGGLRYFISVTNLTASPVNVEGRYTILGAGFSAGVPAVQDVPPPRQIAPGVVDAGAPAVPADLRLLQRTASQQ